MRRRWLAALVASAAPLFAHACKAVPQAAQPNAGEAIFVFVQIPEPLQPTERSVKYEEPLQVALSKAKLGEVTGGGTQLGDPGIDGVRGIEWVGVDVEVANLEKGIPFLKEQLTLLGAPSDTVLEFQRAGTLVREPIK